MPFNHFFFWLAFDTFDVCGLLVFCILRAKTLSFNTSDAIVLTRCEIVFGSEIKNSTLTRRRPMVSIAFLSLNKKQSLTHE